MQDGAQSTLVTFGGVVAEIDSPNIPAGSSPLCVDMDFDVTGTFTRAGIQSVFTFASPPSPSMTQFDWVKTFEMTDGTTLTLALDNAGTLWQEDIINTPDVLTPFFTAIEPDTFAVSVTEDDREFIAFSDLSQGTDMPRGYDGTNLDRLSQVGPGAGVAVTFASSSYPIVQITQNTSFNFASVGSAVLWSTGPTIEYVAGNVITLYFNVGTDISALMVGLNVILSGFSGALSALNNISAYPYYTINSVGTAEGSGGAQYPIITFVAPSTNFLDLTRARGQQGAFGTVTLTLSTLTTSVPVPNLQVGGQMDASGVTPSTWDGTWTVLFTPNAAQMNITSTVLSGNVATYTYVLVSGTAPTVGQQVTVTNTANGNGIFNVANAVITSVGANSFSISLVSPNIGAASETGQGIVNGTIFQFDPLEIIANGASGSVVIAGGLGAGTRGCVVMFETRNGYITEPSPQTIFTLNAAANTIIVTNIPLGPPDVIRRIIAFTGAGGATQSGGGGFYYYIPQNVVTIENGQTVTYTATVVPDNTSTQASFTFTDAILLAATGISIQGNNLFAQIELGSCLGVIAYSERLFAWGEQNKVDNFLNWSFDGGIGTIVPPPGDSGTTVVQYPLGWTVDPNFGMGGSVVTSPLFGDAYQISNTTGSTQLYWGMITQPAYTDEFGTPIIETATTYSVRVTAGCPTGAASGNLVIDLVSPTLNTEWGFILIPLSSMTAGQTIFTGTLLTTPFATVPKDLILRVLGTHVLDGTQILIDRLEVFPTLEPVLTTQMRGSYIDNFEAFDTITGNLGVGSENQQPIRNAFTLFDNLYIVKTASMYETSDNGVTEPGQWTVKEVSKKVGTPSIHGVDIGEGWALICGQAGLYLFTGGNPVKISPELDGDPGIWQAINWKYGNTLWIRNDTANRRILIGVPMVTPNQWMPNFPAKENPTQPNVVLMCNYRELMTAQALETMGPIKLTYTGELRSLALGRKWSAWSIKACYADFVTRPDTLTPVFFCGDAGTGKIYQQITGVFNDDGAAIPSFYVTYPFPKSSEAQQLQLGQFELEATYGSMLVTGVGMLNGIIYPDSLNSADQEAMYPFPLGNPPTYGDLEFPLNQVGRRFFIGVGNAPAVEGQSDSWFRLSKMTLMLQTNPWAEVSGGTY